MSRIVTLGLLLAGPVIAAGGTAPVAAEAATAPHWSTYKWSGGTQTAPIRAFWLIDRTGDADMHDALRFVANAWNAARETHEDLPYVAVYQDDANLGRCLVNQTPGWSFATACTVPNNIEDVKALVARNPDGQGHLTGGALAISDGLTREETVSVACHTIGHLVGLGNSDDTTSCMSHAFEPGVVKWYTQDDADSVLGLYDHSETASSTTSTTVAPTTTTTAPAATTTTAGVTTTTAPPDTTTTEPPTTLPPETTTTSTPS